jgi:hypothetical protein
VPSPKLTAGGAGIEEAAAWHAANACLAVGADADAVLAAAASSASTSIISASRMQTGSAGACHTVFKYK